MYFAYGKTEVSYLRRKDKRLCAVIDQIGHIDRAVDTDLFSSVIHHIIGQQISTKAQATIWQRMQDALVKVNAETILAAGIPKLQALGMTFRKAEYITDFAEKSTPALLIWPPWSGCPTRTPSKPAGAERDRRVDCGDDSPVLYAAPRYFQLRRPCHSAGLADGLSPSGNRPGAV